MLLGSSYYCTGDILPSIESRFMCLLPLTVRGKDTFVQHFLLDSGSWAQLDYKVDSETVQSSPELVIIIITKDLLVLLLCDSSPEIFTQPDPKSELFHTPTGEG